MSIRLGVAIIVYVLANAVLTRGKERYEGLRITALMFSALLFIICPLAFSPAEGYFNIGDFKYKFYVVFVAGFLASALILLIRSGNIRKELPLAHKMDVAALLYLVFAMIAFLFSGDLKASFFGSETWKSGFLFQFVLVCIYLITSRYMEHSRLWLRAVLLTGCFIFAIGILQRFSIDPLRLYTNVDPLGQLRFLSTIGQATWYSVYLCLIFPLGIGLFMASSKVQDMTLSVLFVALGSMSLVTQNSDSAYIAVFIEFVLIAFMCILCGRGLDRLGISVVLISAGVLVTGLLEKSFSESLADLDPLSVWMAQGPLPVAGIVLGGLLYFFSKVPGIKSDSFRRWTSGIFLGICIFVLGGAIGYLFMGDNVSGGALSGYEPFADSFGNGRGLIWKRTFEMYRDLPVWRKIIGIGPGMFSTYISKYTELNLDNAHCQWLTILVESGIGAALAYATLFVMSVAEICRSACRSKDMNVFILIVVLAGALAGSMGHGLSSDQQTLTTPMLFVLMGMALNISDKADMPGGMI